MVRRAFTLKFNDLFVAPEGGSKLGFSIEKLLKKV